MGRACRLAFLLVLVAGCGSPSPRTAKPAPAEQPAPEAGEPAVERSITAGGVEMVASDDNNQKVWSARSETATLDMMTNDNVVSRMAGVTGDLFQKGEVASTYRAEEAFANRTDRKLTLKGGVQVQNSDGPEALSAQALDWIPDKELIQLRGDVSVSSGKTYQAGPFGLLWATPDLNIIGTPDTFQPKPNMKALLASLAITTVLAPQSIVFKSDDLVVRGMTSWRAERSGEIAIIFKGKGNPFTMELPKRQMELRGVGVEGEMIKNKSGAYELRNAQVTGPAEAQFQRDGKTQNLKAAAFEFSSKGETATVTATGGTTLTSADETFKSSSITVSLVGGTGKAFEWRVAETGGPFTYDRKDAQGDLRVTSGRGRYEAREEGPLLTLQAGVDISQEVGSPNAYRVTMKGQTARVHQTVAGDLARAAVSGGVAFTYKSNTGDTMVVSGSCDEGVYQPSNRRITLSGNVVLKGNTDVLMGEMTASEIVITLNEKGEVQSVDIQGEPATSKVRNTP